MLDCWVPCAMRLICSSDIPGGLKFAAFAELSPPPPRLVWGKYDDASPASSP